MTDLFNTQPPRRRVKSPARDLPEWKPLPMGAIVLAIDPSVANAGWCLMRQEPRPVRLDSGQWHPRDRDEHGRLEDLANLVALRIRLARESGIGPEHAAIETPAGGGMAMGKNLATYVQSVGVCRATCFRMGLRIHAIGVNTWKGSGKKLLTANIVRSFTGYEPRDTNEADAIGIAIFLCDQRENRMRAQ